MADPVIPVGPVSVPGERGQQGARGRAILAPPLAPGALGQSPAGRGPRWGSEYVCVRVSSVRARAFVSVCSWGSGCTCMCVWCIGVSVCLCWGGYVSLCARLRLYVYCVNFCVRVILRVYIYLCVCVCISEGLCLGVRLSACACVFLVCVCSSGVVCMTGCLKYEGLHMVLKACVCLPVPLPS